MLKRVGLKNFKLHENTQIDARRITVFIGPNNSGKSSIFQALLALRQAALRPNNQFLLFSQPRQSTTDAQPYLYPSDAGVDLGEFPNVLRAGSDSVEIQIQGKPESPGSPAQLLGQPVDIDARFTVTIRNNQLAEHQGKLKFRLVSSQTIGGEWSFDSVEPVKPVLIQLRGHGLSLTPLPTYSLLGAGGIHQGNFIDRPTLAELQKLTQSLAEAPTSLLKSLRPIFPLRGFEEWGYPIADSPRQPNLDRLTLSDRAVALTNALASNVDLKEQLSGRLEELLGLKIDFETVQGRRIKVWARAAKTKGAGTLFVNEGTGANQLPFIFVPVALASPGETILLSEPEAHLHPKMQSQLTAFILKASQTTQLQFFIETHSEHVLHRILHAVAMKELSLDDLAIYYFESKEGKAEVRQLDIDEHGGVKGSLPGFFDQDLDELSEYLEALRGSKG